MTDSAIAQAQATPNESTVAVPKNSSKRKLEWGVYSSIGISNISKSPFSFSDFLEANKANRPATDFSTQASGVGPMATNRTIAAYRAPAPVRKNLAFSVGAEVAKRVTSRLTVTTGLHYNHLSTITSIGSKVQGSAVSFLNDNLSAGPFFLNNDLTTTDYITRYHFIEVPIGIKWQVFKRNPLQLNSGFSVGQLLSTNALYYNAAAGIYYNNNSLYQKTNFSLFTGFNYPVLKFGKSSLWMGPRAQVQVSNLLKKKDYGRQHPYSAGMGLYFSF
jgi:hypothetical protein